jgi:hypothetical protein
VRVKDPGSLGKVVEKTALAWCETYGISAEVHCRTIVANRAKGFISYFMHETFRLRSVCKFTVARQDLISMDIID